MTASMVSARDARGNLASVAMGRRLALAGAIALVANLIAHVVGAAADASWDVAQPYRITVWAVVAATLVVFLIGGLVVHWVTGNRPGFRRVAGWAGLAIGIVSMASLVNAAAWATALLTGRTTAPTRRRETVATGQEQA